ncbi:MAG: molybdenum cofactor guanylyltransferase [Chromatiales bacterium 21-64-14]|nr:MAG: molybdenum cofactor guanylyltransferase [Chromatiales bacterium 21-64-14]HQU15662.1 molybdenum cofactor guanylyltransferase MobA [Gammaproteobacteria bacterium]
MNARELTGVVLAGGRGQRMGGVDKGLVSLCGRPLIEHVLTALAPQVGEVLISANRNHAAYRRYGCRVVADVWEGYPGPLAGIASALQAAATTHVLCVPCDAPDLPADLGRRLAAALKGGDRAAVVHDGVRRQPLFVLLARDLELDLQRYLGEGGRAARDWLERVAAVPVDFSHQADAFHNLNTLEDLRGLEVQLRRHDPAD